jgi:glucosamine--fructose-6-phosphate aminotransferase (isomerizing)
MKIKTLELFDLVKGFISDNDFGKFFSLGSGFNYGMAVEADLKVKEMTQIPSYSYHVMEFNHGPKSLVDENGLILFMTINKYFTESILKMFDDFTGLGSKIVLIGEKGYAKDYKGNIKSFLADENFKSDFVRAFINIPVFQIMSYYKTLSLGLDPDKPRNLDYTTKMN